MDEVTTQDGSVIIWGPDFGIMTMTKAVKEIIKRTSWRLPLVGSNFCEVRSALKAGITFLDGSYLHEFETPDFMEVDDWDEDEYERCLKSGIGYYKIGTYDRNGGSYWNEGSARRLKVRLRLVQSLELSAERKERDSQTARARRGRGKWG